MRRAWQNDTVRIVLPKALTACPLPDEPDTVAFLRESLEDRILVIAHRGDEPRPAAPLPVINAGIPDGTRFINIESGDELTVSHGVLNLPQIDQGATLLRQAS